MSEIQSYPPAFPFEVTGHPYNTGMTLRDYFAASALQGRLITAYKADGEKEVDDMNLANEAYRIADAMLKARGHE